MLVSSSLDRRALLCAAAASSVPWPATAGGPQLLGRIDADSLSPLSSTVASVAGELRYPAWLEGTWRASCSSAGFSMPLGAKFVDPSLIAEARKQVRREYQLRFVSAPPHAGQPALSARQDRRFNLLEEERAFVASDFVVEGADYACDTAHPHGRGLLTVLDTRAVPDQAGGAQGARYAATPSYRFQEELEVLWAAWEDVEPAAPVAGVFVTSELTAQRVLLPTPGRSSSMEEASTSLLELLWRFERPSWTSSSGQQPASVRARYRVAQYLSLPGVAVAASATRDARTLERQAAGRAVSIIDYDLNLVSI